MIRPVKVFLVAGSDLVCCQDDISVFREKYGNRYELVDTIKDSRNLEDVLPRLAKLYNVNDIIIDCHVEKRWGWKYMSEEERLRMVNAVKAYRTGRPWSDEVKQKISASRKGVGNFTGKRHSEMTKMMMSLSRQGQKDPCAGKKWCHHPYTGKERRCEELPEGFVWGRHPSAADHLPKDGRQRRK